MKKLNELLSDEESVRQLSELAQIMENDTDKAADERKNEDNNDIADMLKIGSLIASISDNDINSGLLLALKPHLKEERQKRIDKAIKMLKLLNILDSAKENGLLNEII